MKGLINARGRHAARTKPICDQLSATLLSYRRDSKPLKAARSSSAAGGCVSQLTPVDLSPVLRADASDAARQAAAQAVLHALRSTGCLVVRDPRVPMATNNEFLDLMESYFDRPAADKMADCRPETNYQARYFWDVGRRAPKHPLRLVHAYAPGPCQQCCSERQRAATMQTLRQPRVLPSCRNQGLCRSVHGSHRCLCVQTGATPSGTEVPRCLGDADLQRRMRSYSAANAAVTPRAADVKWRYFWPLRSRGARERGAPASLEHVVPRGMPRWRETLDAWGGSLVDTVETVAQLLAVGYGLRDDTFTRLLEPGHHLLAPTGARRTC